MDAGSRMRHIDNWGFTLAEMLVAMLVGLLVVSGVYQLFVAGLTTQTTTSSQVELDRKAEVAMDDIAFRLRQGGRSILYNTPAILDDWDSQHPDRIHFAAPPGADLEPVPDPSGQPQEVRYWLNGHALMRKIGGSGYSGGVAAASDVQQLSFTFYAYDGSTGQLVPTTLAAQTVAVKALLTLQDGTTTSELESTIKLRNM